MEEQFYVMPHWDLRGDFARGPLSKQRADELRASDTSLEILASTQFRDLRDRIARFDKAARS